MPIPYCPHYPHPKQIEFLRCGALEAFYGGAGGGGKTDGILMAALQFVGVPGYNALILRRTFRQLTMPEAIMDRAREWLTGTGARFSAKHSRWTFPSGATLTFGQLEHDNDVFNYQGPAFHFVGYDELTQFTERQYTYLFSRMRKLQGVSVPLRMRGAGNPGGIGHEWVFQRFVAPEHDPKRVFVSAKLEDNPSLDKESYEASLDELDPVTRAQIRRGDWMIRPDGNMFKRSWFPYIEPGEAGITGRVVRYWDLAATDEADATDPDYTAAVKMRRVGNSYQVEHAVWVRRDPAGVEELLKEVAAEDGPGVDIYIEQEPGSSGKIVVKHLIRNVLHGYTVRAVRETGDKRERAKPASAQAANQNIALVRGAWNSGFLDWLVAFPQKGIHDDIVDSFSGAFRQLQTQGWGAV